MKKIYLKKIIKEQVKDLMEQSVTGSSNLQCFSALATKCDGTGIGQPVGNQGHFPCLYIDGAPANQSHVGQDIKHTGNLASYGHVYKIDSVDSTMNQTTTNIYNSTGANPQNMTTSGAVCPPGCNGGNHNWANMQNWQTTFETNMQNANWFNAPNQPCQFLQNRLNHFQNIQNGLSNFNAYHNILTCKMKHVQQLMNQYNC